MLSKKAELGLILEDYRLSLYFESQIRSKVFSPLKSGIVC